MASPSSPLLPKDAPTPAPTPLSRTAARATGLVRVLFGAACILAPAPTMRLIGINVPADPILTGFVGTREVVIGGLLLAADAGRCGLGRATVREVLWGVAAVEVLDLCVAGAGVARGELGWSGFACLSGVVAAGVALAGEALWGY